MRPAPPLRHAWLVGPPHLWELAAGLGLVLLITARLLGANQILARGDTFLYFYPLWDYRAAALLAGRLPLWAPELFMGAPFLANSQTGVLYPLNWPLSALAAPLAVKAAIGLHLAIAVSGAQVFARRRLGLTPLAGLLAAGLFGLGGYLTAQVEHINQLQALAWFPWLLLALDAANWRRRLAASASVIALQLLAGHTQSVFISLAGAGLYTLGTNWPADWRRPPLAALLGLGGAAALGALLAAAQLAPTLELTRQSLRSGGLPWREALSFSLDPRLLGRALLPGYTRSLFTEFVGYSGVAGLLLATLGLRRERRALTLLALTLVGLALALGAYNPLAAALAALPPFNLFRVPARWLFLMAFGVAQLAGLGLDRARSGLPGRAWLAAGLTPALLIALTPLAAGLTPPGETGPLGWPAPADLASWAAALGLGLLALGWTRLARWRAPLLAGLALIELTAAAQVLPLNRLTAPEAYSSVRPAMTQLLITRDETPPARFLSLSALRFDPGDLAELRGAWEPQLSAEAFYDYLVATKHKEVLSPNLSLAWGVPAVDGFDGGILPVRAYAAFAQLFTGAPSADGRLRENLTAAPDPRLLSLVNARWLITDKVNDAWVDGVFYDQAFTLELAAGQTSAVARLPAFEATALGVIAEAVGGAVRVTTADGETQEWPLRAGRVEFGRPLTPTALTLSGPARLRALSLIDARTGAFQSLTLGPYRLAHSGDVKIYENLAVQPRAFVAAEAAVIADDDAARAALAAPGFDPARTVILAETPAHEAPAGAPTGSAHITAYQPEAVSLTAEGPGYLVLTDAYYPGWTAWVDGEAAPILRADLAFRAVVLPAGRHEVEFRFAPASLTLGLALSGLGVLAVLGLALTGRAGDRARSTVGASRHSTR